MKLGPTMLCKRFVRVRTLPVVPDGSTSCEIPNYNPLCYQLFAKKIYQWNHACSFPLATQLLRSEYSTAHGLQNMSKIQCSFSLCDFVLNRCNTEFLNLLHPICGGEVEESSSRSYHLLSSFPCLLINPTNYGQGCPFRIGTSSQSGQRRACSHYSHHSSFFFSLPGCYFSTRRVGARALKFGM